MCSRVYGAVIGFVSSLMDSGLVSPAVLCTCSTLGRAGAFALTFLTLLIVLLLVLMLLLLLFVVLCCYCCWCHRVCLLLEVSCWASGWE